MAYVSVIVPVYNAGTYLNKCIESVLGQTFRDLELILVDDGSTDGSGRVCDEYAAKDGRIRVLHRENGGSSAARNAGIEASTGDFLSFIDSDDHVSPDFLETMVAHVDGQGSGFDRIVQVGRDETGPEGERYDDICVPPEAPVFIESREFLKTLLLHVGDCSMCTKLTPRHLFNGRRFPEGRLNEDFRILTDMLTEAEGVISLPGYRYHVVYKPESNSRKTDRNAFSRVYEDNIENADIMEERVRSSMPELSGIAVRFGLFQRLDYLLHIPIQFMRKDYGRYGAHVSYIRRHWLAGLFSPYLTAKNKLYLTLFAAAPKLVRTAHAKIKGFV